MSATFQIPSGIIFRSSFSQPYRLCFSPYRALQAFNTPPSWSSSHQTFCESLKFGYACLKSKARTFHPCNSESAKTVCTASTPTTGLNVSIESVLWVKPLATSRDLHLLIVTSVARLIPQKKFILMIMQGAPCSLMFLFPITPGSSFIYFLQLSMFGLLRDSRNL